MVIVKIRGESFKVHKAMLTKDSEYFDKALKGAFIEDQTQVTVLGDITRGAPFFGDYVDAIYRLYYGGNLEICQKHMQPIRGLLFIVGLWALADYFLNERVRCIASVALDQYSSQWTVGAWETAYTSADYHDDKLKETVLMFQNGFLYSRKCNVPYMDTFAKIGARMPLQLYEKLYDDLNPDFRSAVMKKIFARFANPALKRPSEGIQTTDSPVKRQK